MGQAGRLPFLTELEKEGGSSSMLFGPWCWSFGVSAFGE